MNLIEQQNSKIRGILSTFDRFIAHGYLISFQNPRLLLYYLIQKQVLLVDFHKFACEQTEELCKYIEDYTEKRGVNIEYITTSKVDKNEIAKNKLKERNYKTGLICAFSALEICNIMTVASNRETQKLEIMSKETKCKHYYLYFNHKALGFMFIKIQTTFPYNIGIYINGREYLSKVLDRKQISYEMFNNSFSYIEDFDKAQDLADELSYEKLLKYFSKLANDINPLLSDFKNILNHEYFWCIDQCEYAMDINFKKANDLKCIYKKLVENAYFAFNSESIYSFFGKNSKRIHLFTQGSISSDLRLRDDELRIKFKLNNNQIKMYDKGNNLRIEVTINNPRDFKIVKQTNEKTTLIPMGKSLSNLDHYVEVSKSIIDRFISALPEIEEDFLSVNELKKISVPKIINGKLYPAFNIFEEETLKLFQIISNGKYLIQGFNNKMIRDEFFENGELEENIERTTRMLAKLKVHKIIKKVPRKNQYFLTEQGRKIVTKVLLFARKDLVDF